MLALKDIIKFNGVDDNSERCQSCYGMNWAPVCKLSSGKIIKGIHERSRHIGSIEGKTDPIIFQAVEDCTNCFGARLVDSLENSGQKMAGEFVAEKTIEKLAPYLIPMSGNVPTSSILLYGLTGVGKTLLAKFWFNAIKAEKNADSSSMIWFTERKLFDMLGEKDAWYQIKSILKKQYIFIDESYELVNHQDQSGSNSVTAQKKQSNYRELINQLYERRTAIVIMTSNNLPEMVINDAYMQRRHKELFSSVINLDTIKNPQVELKI